MKRLSILNIILIFLSLLIVIRNIWVSGIALDEGVSYSTFFQDNIFFEWIIILLLLLSFILSVIIINMNKD